jgi:hypothetical protein
MLLGRRGLACLNPGRRLAGEVVVRRHPGGGASVRGTAALRLAEAVTAVSAAVVFIGTGVTKA